MTVAPGMDRLSVDVDANLIEQMRNIVWWRGGSWKLRGIVETALRSILLQLHAEEITLSHPQTGELVKKRPGEPYPPREGSLRNSKSE